MTSRAAAKGRKLLFLAAVCLLPALLLSPTAEASRDVPSAALNLEPLAPHWEVEESTPPSFDLFHIEDELLLEILTGVEPENHQALLEHRHLELLPPSTVPSAIQKTASGVSTSDLRLNVQKPKPLKPDLRWTVPFYAKARFYDPEVGRFLTEDPAEPDLTTPPSLHKYLYAYGNPTRYWDPTGLSSRDAHRWGSEADIPDGTVYVNYGGEFFDMNFDSWPEGGLGDYEFVLNHATEWGYKKKSWHRRVGDSAWGFVKKRINGEGVVEDATRLGVVFVDVENQRASRLSISDENLERVLQGDDQTGVTRVAGAAFRAGGTLTASALIVVEDVSLLTGAGGLVKKGIKDGARIIVKAADGSLRRKTVKNRRLLDIDSHGRPIEPNATDQFRVSRGHPDGGQFAANPNQKSAGKHFGGKLPGTPNREAQRFVQGRYIDPVSNKLVYTDEVLAADHIVPQRVIVDLPGFSDLSYEKQTAVLNYLPNFQGLPKTMNSSKQGKLASEWTEYAGQALSENYLENMRLREARLLKELEGLIRDLSKK